MVSMQVICQYCRNKSERDEMLFEQQGKSKKYYHVECYAKYLVEREEKQKEVQRLDELMQVIKGIHGIDDIPKGFYPFIQDLRNGTIRFRGPVLKKYKEGVPYEVIEEAYRMSESSIAWSKQNKSFKNTMAELKYGLAIVSNNVNDAYKNIRQRKRLNASMALMQKPDENKVEYRKKASEDITDFVEE